MLFAVDDFLKQGDDFVLPDGFPQPRQVVVEQLTVLKELKIGVSRKTSVSSERCTITINPDVSGSEKSSKTSLVNVPSTSKNATSSKVKLEKKTVFTPGKLSYQYKSSMLSKLDRNEPYNLFFTTIPDAYETLDHPNSITFAGKIYAQLLKFSLTFSYFLRSVMP